jgi:hypothetical protein
LFVWFAFWLIGLTAIRRQQTKAQREQTRTKSDDVLPKSQGIFSLTLSAP